MKYESVIHPNESELRALEDGITQDELIRVWSTDSRFTSLSSDEMSHRVTQYWIRQADKTKSQTERLEYFFKGLKFLTAPLRGTAGTLKNPALEGFQWLEKKYGSGKTHKIAVSKALESISHLSDNMGFQDFHAFLQQAKLMPLTTQLYQNSSPAFQPMILEFMVNNLLLKSMIIEHGTTYTHGDAIAGHEARFKQYDADLKRFETEGLRLKASIRGLFDDAQKTQQAMNDFAKGQGDIAKLINHQLEQFQ